MVEAQDIEPVAVEAHFDEQGTITPLGFTWRGQSYPLSDVGRRWSDERGRYHFLVMTPPDRIFELVFIRSDLRWGMVRRHERPRVV